MPTHPLETAMATHGITIKAEFVPLSKSRNAGSNWKGLNWKVTLQRNGRDVITTDYGAGIGHCPSYNKKAPANWNRPVRMWQAAVCEWECENGFEAELAAWGSMPDFKPKRRRVPAIPGGDVERFERVAILPKASDVVHSLILDSGVLDYATFEEWASEYGYDTDSRKAESTYRACLEIALKLRVGLGETIMAELREACADY